MDSSVMANKEQMLRKLFTDIAKEQHYKDPTIKIEATSSEGANYSSVLFNATISAPNLKELQLFAKVANVNKELREATSASIFETERFVYEDLAEIFKRIEKEAEVPEEHRHVFPKVYGYNQNIYEETIVLENLAAQGYGIYDRMKSIDWPYASKAVQNLAKFHALSMAFEEQNPEEFRKVLTKLTDAIEPAYKTINETFEDYITTALPATREDNKERLQKYFDKIIATDKNVFRFIKPKRRAVLIHYDFRPSNIMHRINEDGSIDLIIVDYQTIAGGCGVADLLYFIFGGSDSEFRAKYYQRLMDHYYDSLSQALKRLRLDPTKIYSREDFDYDLQETFPYALISALMLLPIVTVESQHAPDINADGFKSMARPTTSSLYPLRLNGVLDDLIRWGVL